ncbi:caa(3)-type oxidase [Pedobacter changchengzhani]|uniref:Caa(3)-type oxidase n=1 Tax=Pedobacter changchengzhani TaxID=2529274 RepID=A0A4R5MQ55_9SPHI|nr:cytochrome C oxidase subunit IV family protein [Pedobacter changchengzhani]TDG38017.1 caa(3)-type oxidase [Pedobacter changchengzhani]
MAEHTHTNEEHEHGDHAGMDKGKILKVAGILTIITAIEFIIALWAIPGGHIPQHIGNYIYIALTLLKAFYIVAYFMHLKFEKLGLQLVLSLSFILIIYFIVLMLIEGHFIGVHMINH